MNGEREYFNISGEPEDKRWVKEFEEGTRQRLVELSEQSPEFSDFLEKVDFQALKGIFEGIAERSGIDPARINFIEPSRITDLRDESGKLGGGFGVAENIIFISYNKNKSWAKDLGVETELSLLNSLCHEETHALSHTVCMGLREYLSKDTDEDFCESKTMKTVSGYSRGEMTRSGPLSRDSYAFKFFDEAVTERLAREVSAEYLSANQNFAPQEAVKKFVAVFGSKEKNGHRPYDSAVLFLDEFVRRVGKNVGVDADTVWRAIVRGKLEGVDFNDPDLNGFFSSIFPQDFIKRMSRADSSEQLLNIIEELDIQEEGESWKGVVVKIKRWLSSLRGEGG